MKYAFFVFLLLTTSFALSQDHHLSVKIEGATSDDGKILYTVFSSKEGFPGKPEKALKSGIAHIENGESGIDLDLPKGEYALMVFHDEDDNNELKTNWFGMPKDGVGNSNNHKGIPSYPKSVFKLSDDKTIVINLWYM